LQRVLVDFGAEESFERAAARVKEHCGIEVAVGRVRAVTLRHAAAMSTRQPAAPKHAADCVVTEMDGNMMPVVVASPEASDARKGKPLLWREARLCLARGQEKVRVLAGHLESEGTAEAPVRTAHRYLTERRGLLDYAGARGRGLPIESGEIESGHRRVVQQRLKLAGAWWKEANAEAMLGLRVGRANGLWESYWQEPVHAQN
jgi:hypothetical protein